MDLPSDFNNAIYMPEGTANVLEKIVFPAFNTISSDIIRLPLRLKSLMFAFEFVLKLMLALNSFCLKNEIKSAGSIVFEPTDNGTAVLSIPTSMPLKISSTVSVLTSVKSEPFTPVPSTMASVMVKVSDK